MISTLLLLLLFPALFRILFPLSVRSSSSSISSPFLACLPSLVSAGHACLPPWLTNNPKDVTPSSVCAPRERHRFAGRRQPHRRLAHWNELESKSWKKWIAAGSREKKNPIFKLVAHEESRRELCVFGLMTRCIRTVLWRPACLNEGRDEVKMKGETGSSYGWSWGVLNASRMSL